MASLAVWVLHLTQARQPAVPGKGCPSSPRPAVGGFLGPLPARGGLVAMWLVGPARGWR